MNLCHKLYEQTIKILIFAKSKQNIPKFLWAMKTDAQSNKCRKYQLPGKYQPDSKWNMAKIREIVR